jgi:hypothetical protein
MWPIRDPHQASDADWFRVYETFKHESGYSIVACVKARINAWAGFDNNLYPVY